MFYIFGFYKFKKLTNLKLFKDKFINILKINSIRGSIIVSQEGLNGTISGKQQTITRVIKKLKLFYNFKKFDSENVTECAFHPFNKCKIKIKKEVVPIGIKLSKINKKNTYITPVKWNSLLKQKDVSMGNADQVKENRCEKDF